MPNMSYCRFQNTLNDLRQCAASIEEREELSEDERQARRSLIEICQQIVDETDGLSDDELDGEEDEEEEEEDEDAQ